MRVAAAYLVVFSAVIWGAWTHDRATDARVADIVKVIATKCGSTPTTPPSYD